MVGTDPVAELAKWVADLRASVRRARRRRRVIMGSVAAGIVMLAAIGVALTTDDHVFRHTTPSGDTPSVLPREENGVPVNPVTPARAPGALTVSAHADTDLVAPGQRYTVTVSWRDARGTLLRVGQDWGDGTKRTDAHRRRCNFGKSEGTLTFAHTWAVQRTYVVRFTVTTATCDGDRETESVSFPVRVSFPPQAITSAPLARATAPGRPPQPAPRPPKAPRPAPSPPPPSSAPPESPRPPETPGPSEPPTPSETPVPSDSTAPTPGPTETTGSAKPTPPTEPDRAVVFGT